MELVGRTPDVGTVAFNDKRAVALLGASSCCADVYIPPSVRPDSQGIAGQTEHENKVSHVDQSLVHRVPPFM